MLGPYLVAACRSLGQVITSGRRSGSRPCDLTDVEGVRSLIAETRPTVVVHAAAMTDVDLCQQRPDLAEALNEVATENLASGLPEDTQLVMVSTDQVYPDVPGPHREPAVGPVNVYGETKLAAEETVLGRLRGLVLRTNFFGPSRSSGRQSLSDFVVGRLRAGDPVVLFEDVLFSPLHMATFASLLALAVSTGLSGVYNVGCRSGASKAAFGMAVARHLSLTTNSVTLGRSRGVPGRAPRPLDLRMDVSRLEMALGRPMPMLDDEVAKL